MGFLRYRLPALIMRVIIVLVVLGGFLQVKGIVTASAEIVSWATLLALFGVIVGIVTISSTAIRSVIGGQDLAERVGDAWVLIVMVVVAGLGLTQGIASPSFTWLFDNVMMSFEGAGLSLIGFFSISAMWRALRFKNAVSGFFVTGVFVTLLNATGMGERIWSGFPSVVALVQGTLNMASMRGINVAIGVGLAVTALRTLLGLEKSYMGTEKE